MRDRQELETLFVAHLPAAEKILSALAHRHTLSREDSEEFAAWAKLRLIENDYAILAKFRGESTLPTYLTVVLSTLLLEYRVKEWGRWRPSAAAKRGGPIALKLEALINRDGLSVSQACQVLRSKGPIAETDRELANMAAQLPMRTPLRPVQPIDATSDAAGADRADDLVTEEETEATATAAKRALDDALQTLPGEDRLIVRLHYLESMTIADIARALALPQARLYPRLKKALGLLRDRLERAGVSRDHVRELVMGPP